MATGFGIALHNAGLPVGPDRCERLARAVTVMGATTVAELRACALATMVSDPGQMPTFDRVFAAVFGGPSPFRHLNLPTAAASYERPESDGSPAPQGRSDSNPGDLPSGLRVSDAVPAAADSDEPLVEGPAVHRIASATERLQRPRLHRAVRGRTPPAGHAHARDDAGHPAPPDPQVPHRPRRQAA